METSQSDICIIGGGAAGMALAVALAQQDSTRKVTVVEAQPIAKGKSIDAFDARVLALSYGSKLLLEQLQIWQQLSSEATPIEHIHVSDRGHFGQTRLNYKDYPCDALGFVVELQKLGEVLNNSATRLANLELLQPVKLTSIEQFQDHNLLRLDNGSEISCKLLVAADGGNSNTRKLLNIDDSRGDYQQSAVIANIQLEQDHKNWAFERFTNTGPIALLPMQGKLSSLVWTVKPEQLDQVMSWNDEQFLNELQLAFGFRLGRFTAASKRFSYPLTLIKSQEQIRHRAVILGNASHNLHPIAGQGFNLGLRDVAALTQVLSVIARNEDPGCFKLLKRYLSLRESDQANVINMTDGLVRIFSNDFAPMIVGRNLGLLAMQAVPQLKNILAHQAMGSNAVNPQAGIK